MWNLEELKLYLEEEKLHAVTSEQMVYCRYMCLLLNDTYDIELRNETFSAGRKVNAVAEIKEGELCLISSKRYPTEEEFQRSLVGKAPALKTNMERAYQRGEKCYYDNPANKAFSAILKHGGYLHSKSPTQTDYTPDGAALKPILVANLKTIFREILDRYLDTNMPNRNEVALHLVTKESAFVHLATDTALSDPDYCLQLLRANPSINIKHFHPTVYSSWSFVDKLMKDNKYFTIEDMDFPASIMNVLLYAKHKEHHQQGLLSDLVQYFTLQEKLSNTLKDINIYS